MPWIKIDDQFADHPKVMKAGPLAGWLYVCGLCYCGRYLTDGFIPREQLVKLANVPDAADLAERLVAVGLWEHTDDGYLVHDYLLYNPSGEQVKSQRDADAKRQAEWRASHRQQDGRFQNDTGESNTVSHAVTNDRVTAAPSPSPSPSPIPKDRDALDVKAYAVVLARWAALLPGKPQPRPNNRTLAKKALTRMADAYFRENWDSALVRAARSSFLKDAAWFDLAWFLENSDNWEKCLSGKYDDKKPTKPAELQGWEGRIPG